jgi:hypothetical protein
VCLIEYRLNTPKAATSKNRRSHLCRREILLLATCDRDCGNRRVGEHEKRDSLHIVDLRHPSNRRVVNNSAYFLLAISRSTVVNGIQPFSASDGKVTI